eukprot:SAG11_NODE_19397_length_467_cov_1.404891_1_plen_113_part_10
MPLRTRGAGARIEGAGGLCLDVQDADTKDGANVFAYACGPRPGGNQRWKVTTSHAAATVTTLLDGKCLGTPAPSNHTGGEVAAELHESTLGCACAPHRPPLAPNLRRRAARWR